MTSKLIIFLAITMATVQIDMPCVHVWDKDYLVFLYRDEEKGMAITNPPMKQSADPGTVLISCDERDIPAVCQVPGKARFVYVVEGSPCVIIRNPVDVKYEDRLEALDGKSDFLVHVTITGKAEPAPAVQADPSAEPIVIKLQFHHDQLAAPEFRRTASGFIVNVVPRSNPVHELKFLRVLKENPVISTVIFFTLGLVLCFFGLKFYKDMLMFFIPLMIVVLAFYLYLSIVEKSVETNDKLLLILLTLLCLAGFIALAVTFTNVIYIILCLLASYQLGIILHKMLEPSLPFFARQHSEYIPIVLLFAGMMVLYYRMKDYFVIVCTALVGSFFMILGMSYSGVTEVDFLFSLEIGKFKNLEALDPATKNLIAIFLMVFLLGIFVQIWLFKRRPTKSAGHGDLRIELRNI